MPSTPSEGWVEQQRRTFTVWFNARVKDVDIGGTTEPIHDVQTDLDDGVQLLRLMAALYDKFPPPKLSMRPKNVFEKREDINAALKFAEEAGVNAPLTKDSNFVEHDLRMILGFIWSVILHYSSSKFQGEGRTLGRTSSTASMSSSSVAAAPLAASGRGTDLKNVLLQYCRRCLEGTGIPMDNFTSHWCDGRAFLGLLHHHDPETVPDFAERCAAPVDDIEQRRRNLEDAFAAAERIGAPRLLLVDDVAGPEDPDEHSVMTYVAELHSAFETDKAHREKERAAAAERASSQAELDRTAAELKAAREAEEASSAKAASTQREAAEALDKLAAAEAENERLKKELADEKARAEQLEKRAKDAHEAEEASNAKAAEAQDKLAAAEAENARLKKELEDERKKPAPEPKEEPKEEPKPEVGDETFFKAGLVANVALASFLSGVPFVVLGVLALALLLCEMLPELGSKAYDYVPRDQQKLLAFGNIAATLAALLFF